MPLPEKLKEKLKQIKYTKPFAGIDEREFKLYKAYEYARQQYFLYVNYLNNTNEESGYGTEEDGISPKKMDAEAVKLLEEVSTNLLITGNIFNKILRERIKKISDEKQSSEISRETSEIPHETSEISRETKKQLTDMVYQVSMDTNRAVSDISMLAYLDKNNFPSYMSMHRQATEVVIDAGNVKLEKAGDATSQRMILRYIDENGNIQKGYFTKDVRPCEMDDKQKTKFVSGYQIGKYESVNQRNTAMSDVATLLGMDHIIAKSTNMVVMVNGKPVHGSFMANAKGFEGKDVKAKSSFFNCKPITVDYNRVVRSCTDMMVLDYICGNADRHDENQFYRFEHDEKGNPQLVGFQGIDNDLSFVRILPAHRQRLGYLSPIVDIKYMSTETKNRVMNLSEDTLIAALSHNDLDSITIGYCVQRLNALKLHISGFCEVSTEDGKKKLMKYGDEYKIQIKDQFTEEDYTFFANGADNIGNSREVGSNPISNYKRYVERKYDKNAVKNASKEKQKIVNKTVKEKQQEAQKKNETIDVKKLREDLMNDLDNKSKEQYLKKENEKRISDGIKNLQHKLHMDVNVTLKAQAKRIYAQSCIFHEPNKTDTASYRNMYKAVHGLSNLVSKMAETQRERPLSEKEQNMLAAIYKETENKIKDFVTDMSENTMKWNDRRRISVATCLQKLCIAGREQREFQIQEFNELMVKAHQQRAKLSEKLSVVCELLDYDEDQDKKDPEPDKLNIRYRLAKAEFDALGHVSSYIGNIIAPDKKEDAKIQNSVANLLLTSHLEKMKTTDQDMYHANLRALSEKPETLSKMTAQVMKDKNFMKLLNGIRPTQIVDEKVRNAILEKAEEFKCFKALDKSVNKMIEAEQKIQKTKAMG